MIGMGHALANSNPIACQVFQEADEALGFHLSRLAWEGPEEELNDTVNTQPAMLTHSVAILKVLYDQYPELTPTFVAGHSMGELSALVASEALPFPDALRLVRRRGELMKRAGEVNPGGMAAILGLDIPTLEKICAQASVGTEIVQVANDNCPGQVVISGSSSALERAVQLARETGARHAKTLAVSIAAHSPMMANAQADFNQAVGESPIVDPRFPLVGNVSAKPLSIAAEIRSDLQGQLNSRVRWTESIQTMVSAGVTIFLELGSGSVLTGLLKRINREVNGVALGNPEDFEKFSA